MKKIFLTLIVFSIATVPALAQVSWQDPDPSWQHPTAEEALEQSYLQSQSEHCLELHNQLRSVVNQIDAILTPVQSGSSQSMQSMQSMQLPDGVRKNPRLRSLEQRQAELLAEIAQDNCLDIIIVDGVPVHIIELGR